QAFSIVIVLPIALVVYLAAATILGTIPRADLDTLLLAVLRKGRATTPKPKPQPGGVPALALSAGEGALSHVDTAEHEAPRPGQAARAGWLRVANLFVSGEPIRGGPPPQPPREPTTSLAGARQAAPAHSRSHGARRLLTATIKYITNHVITHTPSHALRMTWY